MADMKKIIYQLILIKYFTLSYEVVYSFIVVGFARSDDPKNYAGDTLISGKVFFAGPVLS